MQRHRPRPRLPLILALATEGDDWDAAVFAAQELYQLGGAPWRACRDRLASRERGPTRWTDAQRALLFTAAVRYERRP